MMSKKTTGEKTALVLGGTAPHIELIQQLKAIGYYVVLVDYLENPPAREYANIHVRESTLDVDAVLRVAKEYCAELVISACIDQSNSVCCYVAEKLGLPHPYSYGTSILVTVKSEMKKIMVVNGVPTSWFYEVDNQTDLDWNHIAFPAVVKPVDCNSSKGVKKVTTVEEAKTVIAEDIKLSRAGKAIIEGYVEGIEIQVDCFATDNGAEVILTRQKKQIQRDLGGEMNSEGSILPAPVCQNFSDSLKDIARRIAMAFGLRNTPFFYQAIIDSEGIVNVLEFAPRVGGGLSYYILNNIAGFNAIRAVINSYLGIHEPISHKKLDHFFSTNLLYMNKGVFDHIEGFDKAKQQGLIVESFVTKEKGTSIGSKLRSGNRVGAFIVEADSIEELKEKENQTYALIDIIDSDGKSQMRNWRK